MEPIRWPYGVASFKSAADINSETNEFIVENGLTVLSLGTINAEQTLNVGQLTGTEPGSLLVVKFANDGTGTAVNVVLGDGTDTGTIAGTASKTTTATLIFNGTIWTRISTSTF